MAGNIKINTAEKTRISFSRLTLKKDTKSKIMPNIMFTVKSQVYQGFYGQNIY